MKKVVIIGGGPAGLTAAYELTRLQGYEVTLLEGSQAFGGISRTLRSEGCRMDIGGHRFFSKDKRVTQWWDNLLPMQGAPAADDGPDSGKAFFPGGPDPAQTDEVMLLRQRVSRIYYKKAMFDYPVTLNGRTIRSMGFGTTLKAGFSYLATLFRKLPEDSLENFYINRFGRVLYRMFFEGYTEKLWGRPPREISAEWGAQRVKGLSILAVLKDIMGKMLPKSWRKNRKVETSLIEQFLYPKLGPGQLWELVAQKVSEQGGAVLTGAFVNKLHTKDGAVTSVGYTQNGQDHTLEADVVISSMPVKDLFEALTPAVSLPAQQVAAGLPYRDFVTVGLLLPRDAFLLKDKDNGLTPDCWIYVQDTSVKLGRIQIFNNWSPYMVDDFKKHVWIGLEYFFNEGDQYWNMSDQDFITFAIEELKLIGLLKSEKDVLHSVRERVQKAYPAYFDTYAQFPVLREVLDNLQNLYCVGRNGQHRYNNMDHSMITAFETVANIISGRTDRENIWNVNTETEYHEEKEDRK